MLTPAYRLGVLTLALFGGVARTLDGQAIATHPRVKEALAAYEKWLDGERAFKKIPGIASALVIDQDVIWQGGTGYADLARKTPATPTTLYSICSISKLFTSISTLHGASKRLIRIGRSQTVGTRPSAGLTSRHRALMLIGATAHRVRGE